MIPNTFARVALGVAHARRNSALARRCLEFLLLLKCKFHIPVHRVCSHAVNAGNECAYFAASLGMKGFYL